MVATGLGDEAGVECGCCLQIIDEVDGSDRNVRGVYLDDERLSRRSLTRLGQGGVDHSKVVGARLSGMGLVNVG